MKCSAYFKEYLKTNHRKLFEMLYVQAAWDFDSMKSKCQIGQSTEKELHSIVPLTWKKMTSTRLNGSNRGVIEGL